MNIIDQKDPIEIIVHIVVLTIHLLGGHPLEQEAEVLMGIIILHQLLEDEEINLI